MNSRDHGLRSGRRNGIDAQATQAGGASARVRLYLTALYLAGLTGGYRALPGSRTEGEGPPG